MLFYTTCVKPYILNFEKPSELHTTSYTASALCRIHAVAVCDNSQYFYDHVDQTLEAIGIGDKVKSTDILDVVDGYKGKGYGLTTDEDLGNS